LGPQRLSRSAAANFAASENDRIPRFFGAIPASVPIHCKIPADDRRDSRAAPRQAGSAGVEKLCTARRGGVAAVSKYMHENVGHTCSPRCLGKCDEMFVVTVNTAIGNESEKMEPMSARIRERRLRERI